MRILMQEIKKLFRPCRCIVAFIVLLAMNILVPQKQARIVNQMHTEDYPEQLEIYNDCSVQMLFEDHLLEVYGEILTKENMNDLRKRKDVLEEQLVTAAGRDEVLLRVGTAYEKGLGFVSTRSYEEAINEEDQLYEWSCVNGQAKLAGMDHPIYFLNGYQIVLDILKTDGVYHVLGTLPLSCLNDNLHILLSFVYAAIFLIIPYCVLETQSRTEALAYTAKIGRFVYIKKIFTATFAGFVVTLLGVVVIFALFSQWEVQRYYDAVIDSGLSLVKEYVTEKGAVCRESLNYGITYFNLYIMLIGILLIGSLSIFPVTAVICLNTKYTVTAVALCLPIFALCEVFWFRYFTNGIGRSGAVLPNRYEPYILIAAAIAVAAVVTIFSYIHKKKQSL